MPNTASQTTELPAPNNEASPYLMYKKKPLVQCGDVIYYGSMTEDYVVMMQVLDHANLETGTDASCALPDHLIVKLIKTDITLNPLEQIVKTAEKQGLYSALDLASIWLQEALKAS